MWAAQLPLLPHVTINTFFVAQNTGVLKAYRYMFDKDDNSQAQNV